MHRILIVDDNESQLTALGEILCKSSNIYIPPIDIVLAGTGDEAWDVLNRTDPNEERIHAIISDYRMPGKLNGIQLLNTIRESGMFRGMPYVLMSADFGEEEFEAKAAICEPTAILRKPLDATTVRKTVSQILQDLE